MTRREESKARLADLEGPAREALERLAETPRELLCYVAFTEPVTKRFVQIATPPPASKFAGSERIVTDEPLIFDGTGDGRPGGYERILEPCGIDRAVDLTLDTLARYLPPDAEICITGESCARGRAS